MDEDDERSSDNGVDDMINLDEFTEAKVLENVHKRFRNDSIYTYVADIVISLNPYRSQIKGVHGNDVLKAFHVDNTEEAVHQLPPHIYSVARRALRGVMGINADGEKKNQAILISGESGAGKTETTKYVLSYLASMSAGKQDMLARLEHKDVGGGTGKKC